MDPIILWDTTTGRLADFTTRFTFKIEADNRSSLYDDGLAFFSSNSDQSEASN
jgi:hypothetical protein